MKFQIIPNKQGQICRMVDETRDANPGEVYILVDNPLLRDENDLFTIVSLTDLQRHSAKPQDAPKKQIKKDELTVVADSLEKYVQSWNYTVKVPKSLKAYAILKLDDVKDFFRDIHRIYDAEFHPDDDFKDFTDEKEQRTFTDEEADYLNTIMINCFQVCDDNDVEIYDVAGEVQIELWREKGIWPTDN